MKQASNLLALIGILLIVAAVIGRFSADSTVFGIIGIPLAAKTVLHLAEIALLLSVVAKLNAK